MPVLRWHCVTAAYAKDGRCLKFPLSSSSPHVFPCGTEEAEPPLRHWRRMSRASAPVSWCLCTHVTCISLAVMQTAFTRCTLEPRLWLSPYTAVIHTVFLALILFLNNITWTFTHHSYVLNLVSDFLCKNADKLDFTQTNSLNYSTCALFGLQPLYWGVRVLNLQIIFLR